MKVTITIAKEDLFFTGHDERSEFDLLDRQASAQKFMGLFKSALATAFPGQEIEVVWGETDDTREAGVAGVYDTVYEGTAWEVYRQAEVERAYRVNFTWDHGDKTWRLSGEHVMAPQHAVSKEVALARAVEYLMENYGFPMETPDTFLSWVHVNQDKAAQAIREYYGTFGNYVDEIYTKRGYRPEPVETWEQIALDAAHHYRGDGGLAEVHQLLREVYAKHTLYFANGLPKYELLAEVQDDPSVVAAVAVDNLDAVEVVLNANGKEARSAFEDRHANHKMLVRAMEHQNTR